MLRTLTFTAAMGLALALLPLAPAAASTTWVVDDDGAATTTDCSATAPTHRRISTAIAAAAAGDAVKVCPGTYVEDVILDKTVRLTGPFASVDARTRSGQGEAVITGVAGNGSPTVQITGRKAALDGITVRGSAEHQPSVPAQPRRATTSSTPGSREAAPTWSWPATGSCVATSSPPCWREAHTASSPPTRPAARCPTTGCTATPWPRWR